LQQQREAAVQPAAREAHPSQPEAVLWPDVLTQEVLPAVMQGVAAFEWAASSTPTAGADNCNCRSCAASTAE
jgi:hypothetical protein